ncbi:MAG: tetratricopeptide repeat protein [Deltaproteobacteria bacterium]|nr:tetratricopeptide repeat protein [Deltaproteobacteria bacterium]
MKMMALEKPDMTSVVSPGTSQVFLFSKTLSPSGKGSEASHLSDSLVPVLSEEIQDAFSSAFPGVLAGQAFVDEALKQMGDSGFSVLMIRSDSRLSAGVVDAVDPFLLNAGFILEQLSRPVHAMWGLIRPDTLGCVIPETDLSVCRNLAVNIQNSLAQFQKETVFIGIAVYPLAGFTRNDTVWNAWKALTHAAIMGTGSLVVLDAVSLNISGDQLYQAGNLPGAVEEYQKALQLDSANVNVHNSLGVCYGMMEMYDAAEAEFDAALLLKPDEVMALYNLGVICLLTGRKELALNFFMKAAAIDDGIFELALLTGKLYLEAGSPEKARPFLENALNSRPKSGTALRTLGACLSALNLPREATAIYTRAVKNNPGDAESFSQLGQLYDTIGENPEIARLFCQQSVAIAPENEVYRERLNRLMQKGQRADD